MVFNTYSKRICPHCGVVTSFVYSKKLGHSVCMECGWHGNNINPKLAELLKVKAEVDAEVESLRSDFDDFEKSFKRRRDIVKSLNERIIKLEKLKEELK